MARYEFRNLNLGGLSDTKYQGVQNSYYRSSGFDVTSEPGVMKVQKDLTSKYSTGDACTAIVPATTGDTYFFGDDKIFKRTSGGTYSTVANGSTDWNDGATPTPNPIVLDRLYDAKEYGDHIFFTGNYTGTGLSGGAGHYLGYWTKGTSWTGSSPSPDSSKLTTNSSNYFYPIAISGGDLYVGDGYLLHRARINSVGTISYTSSVLDLPKDQIIQFIHDYYGNLLIGTVKVDTTNNTPIGNSKLYLWDHYSESWHSEDEIPEQGIYNIFEYRNNIYICAGTKGNIYSYNGSTASLFRRIPGDWTSTNKAICKASCKDPSSNYMLLGYQETVGEPMGITDGAGNSYESCVYGFGSYSSGYPFTITAEYIPTAGGAALLIDKLSCIGDTLLFGYKNQLYEKVTSATAGFTSPVWQSRVFNQKKEFLKTVKVKVYYRNLPGTTTLNCFFSKNDNSFTQLTDFRKDASRKMFYTNVVLNEAASYQVQISSTTQAATAGVEIEAIIIEDNA